MALSLANIVKAVVSRVRADKTAPAATDVDTLTDEVVAIWANELAPEVIRIIQDPSEFEELIVMDTSKTLTASKVSIASITDLRKVVTVKVGTSKTKAKLLFDPALFAEFDGRNFAREATNENPIALHAGQTIHVKAKTSPTTIYIDYIKDHPDINSGTVWGKLADLCLITLLYGRWNAARGYDDRAAAAMNEALQMGAL